MRVSSMDRVNEIKKDWFGYVVFAIAFAFVCFFFLSILLKISVIVFTVALKYWWGVLILFVVIFIIKRRGKKK